MYYLIVRNLGSPRCIERNEEDVFEDGMTFDCTQHMECEAREFVKEVEIICSEHPGIELIAMVFRD